MPSTIMLLQPPDGGGSERTISLRLYIARPIYRNRAPFPIIQIWERRRHESVRDGHT
jgi:hypothetical protein